MDETIIEKAARAGFVEAAASAAKRYGLNDPVTWDEHLNDDDREYELARIRAALAAVADDIRTEALADYEREMFTLPGRTWVNVQWKGVDLCADIECECGASSHIDSDRTYGRWTCHQCGKTFQLAWTQTAYEVEPYGNEIATEADPA